MGAHCEICVHGFDGRYHAHSQCLGTCPTGNFFLSITTFCISRTYFVVCQPMTRAPAARAHARSTCRATTLLTSAYRRRQAARARVVRVTRASTARGEPTCGLTQVSPVLYAVTSCHFAYGLCLASELSFKFDSYLVTGARLVTTAIRWYLVTTVNHVIAMVTLMRSCVTSSVGAAWAAVATRWARSVTSAPTASLAVLETATADVSLCHNSSCVYFVHIKCTRQKRT